ncbi:MAG TPA: hypothetical protein VFQ60_05600 [Patescibacteria group bacterium]|nr:hypothetical protein [Patescibacteria group bacterium]
MFRRFSFFAAAALITAIFGNICPTCLASAWPQETTPVVSLDSHCAHGNSVEKSVIHPQSIGCAMTENTIIQDTHRDTLHQKFTLDHSPAFFDRIAIHEPVSVFVLHSSVPISYLAEPPTLTGTVIKKE